MAVSVHATLQPFKETYRIDIVIEPSNALIHPEIVNIITCTGRGNTCVDKNMIKKMLYNAQMAPTSKVDVQDENRMVFVPKTSIVNIENTMVNQFVQVELLLKHADGTLAQKEPCVVTIPLSQDQLVTTMVQEESHTQGAKQIQAANDHVYHWYAYTGMAMGGACMVVLLGLFTLSIGKTIKKKLNEPKVTYSQTYKFANDPTKQLMSKREKERLEDLELAAKIGLL